MSKVYIQKRTKSYVPKGAMAALDEINKIPESKLVLRSINVIFV